MSRQDVVFIRKSTERQDEQAQIDNVKRMLSAKGVKIPDDRFFIGVVKRKNVKKNERFNALLDLITNDEVGTVFIEKQDRWGTDNRKDLFTLLGILCDHGTVLFDLQNNKDISANDFVTELLAFLDSYKSEKELQDIASRSLRARLSLFDVGAWVAGSYPFGYGKRCFSADGKTLLWEWQPRTRYLGQVFYPDPSGMLVPSPVSDTPPPRKPQGQRLITKLIPSSNPDHVRSVKVIFDLYSRQGLSRRKICHALNSEGLLHFDEPWDVSDVTSVLKNEAYLGRTLYGKEKTASYFTFDKNGIVVPAKDCEEAAPLVKEGTHEALIDAKVFELAEKRLLEEENKRCFAPRNPAHFLKRILVCGHCGKALIGRMETHPKTKQKKAVYVCASYMNGQANGAESGCGYQRITHDEAEKMLLEKLGSLGKRVEVIEGEHGKINIIGRLKKLDEQDDESMPGWESWMIDGVTLLEEYFGEVFPEYRGDIRLTRAAIEYMINPSDEEVAEREGLPISRDRMEIALMGLENKMVTEATERVKKLREEHTALTRSWVRATEEMQRVIKEDIETIERDLKVWEERSVPLSERVRKLDEEAKQRQAEREKLLEEYPSLEQRAKGEALRQHFREVKLFWTKEWHEAKPNKYRKRKTDREGRWSFTLDVTKTKWDCV